MKGGFISLIGFIGFRTGTTGTGDLRETGRYNSDFKLPITNYQLRDQGKRIDHGIRLRRERIDRGLKVRTEGIYCDLFSEGDTLSSRPRLLLIVGS